MKRIIRSLAAILCAAGMLLSAIPAVAGAEEELFPSGMKVSSLGMILERRRQEGLEKPAEACAVLHGDEVVLLHITGQSDLEHGIYADEETVYDWGSVTKTLVWVSVLQLWEAGKLDLDADIRTYLPEGFLQNLRYDEPITMLHLMNHTGGWCESLFRTAVNIGEESKLRTLEEELRATEPAQTWAPGETFDYSNWGCSLAGYIVERVSGEAFADYVHAHIFDPLHMEHTAVAADLSDNLWAKERRLQTMAYKRTSSLTEGYMPLTRHMEYRALAPAGSAAGTIGDLATYASALMDEHSPLFRETETWEKLYSGSAFLGDTGIPSCSYGLFPYEGAAGRFFMHNGFSAFHMADLEIDPVNKYGFVWLTANTDTDLSLADSIFGSPDPAQYPAVSDEVPELATYYASGRDRAAGPNIFWLLFTVQKIDFSDAELRCIGRDTYLFLDENGGYDGIISTSVNADGTKGLSFTGMGMREVRCYLPRLCLLTAYFIAGAAAFFILLIKWKLRRAGRPGNGLCGGILTAAQAAKIVSVLDVILFMAINFPDNSFNIPGEALTVLCIVQIACAVFFAAGAAASVPGLLAKERKASRIAMSAAGLAGNAIALGAVVCFSLYRFWGC